MSDSNAPKKEDLQLSNPGGLGDSSLRLRDKILLIAAIAVLIFGLLVWGRISWGTSVFETAQLWIYQNYGVSRAWAFSCAVLVALLLTANLGFLVAAVLFGRRKDVNRLLVVSALVLIPGTVVYQLSNRDQCFNRTTEAPLCALYKKPDGAFVLHRVDDAEPPSTWMKVRIASRDDVVRYGSSEDDRKSLKPTRITWEICGIGTEIFDSVSGDPKVFFAKIDNRFELFDRPGFHPQLNVRLEPVTDQSAREICKALDAQKAKTEREAKEAQQAQLAETKALDAQKAKAERAANEKALRDQERVPVPNATPQANIMTPRLTERTAREPQASCKVFVMDESNMKIVNPYEGGCKNGLANGQGRYTYSVQYLPNGDTFINLVEGEFRNGKLNGKARMSQLNLDQHVGEPQQFFENFFLMPGIRFGCYQYKAYYPQVTECPGGWQVDYSQTTPPPGSAPPPPPPF